MINFNDKEDLHKFIMESSDSAKKFLEDIVKDAPPELRFILIGRVLNFLFAGFYNPMIHFSNNVITAAENKIGNGDVN